MPDERRPVPWPTILATVAVVLGTLGALALLVALHKIVAWLFIAAFIAIVLNPMVNLLQHRGHLRRGLATLMVFMVAFTIFGAMLYAFIRPLVDQGQEFADNFPTYVQDAQNGLG